MTTSSIGRKKLAQRRRAKRDALWPDAETLVYSPAIGGWTQMPRTIPMIAGLIDSLGGRESAGRLYLTLWAHDYGDGFVEIGDPAQVALEAGYVTNRAERTFDERITLLARLGFVRTGHHGLRDHGYVLLLDPHRVVERIRDEDPTRVPARWWSAFQARCAAVGIPLRGASPTPPESSPLGTPS